MGTKSRLDKLEKRLKELRESQSVLFIKLSDGQLYKLTNQGLKLANEPLEEGTRVQVFDCNLEHLVAFVVKGQPHFIQIQTVSDMLKEQ